MSVTLTVVAFHIIHVTSSATTLSTVPGKVPISVALVALHVIKMTSSTIVTTSTGSSSVGRYLSTWSLRVVYLHLVAVYFSPVHLFNGIFSITTAAVLNKGVTKGSLG